MGQGLFVGKRDSGHSLHLDTALETLASGFGNPVQDATYDSKVHSRDVTARIQPRRT